MSTRRSDPAGKTESGFTLIEVMIAVALLGVATGVITRVFLGSYQLWKWNFDSMLLQRNIRISMGTITRAIREAKQGTIVINRFSVAEPRFSQISFTDGRGQGWVFRQKGRQIFAVLPPPTGVTFSSTRMMASDIDAMTFIYPSFQDMSLLDVAITGRKVPYARAAKPIIVQLVERSMMRNP